MDIRKIDDNLSVSPQIAIEDIAEIARLGFKTLIANRPDGEEYGQPPMTDIKATAEEHGLKWVYLPVASGHITDEDVDAFAPMFAEADKPALAFCRSGTRSTVLWALSSARAQDPQDLLSKAYQAGYDLTGLIGRMHTQQQNNQS